MFAKIFRCLLGLVALSAGLLRAEGPDSQTSPLVSKITQLGYCCLRLGPDSASPMILGAVNGNLAVLTVDTGFSFTTFDRTVVGHLERLSSVTELLDPLLGRLEGTNWFVIRRFTLSRAEFTNMPARVMSLSLGPNRERAKEHGILGIDFLRRNHALIFCGEGRLLLRGNPFTSGEGAQLEARLRDAGYTEVAMESLSGFTWAVPMRIGEMDFKLLVDTGAIRTYLDNRMARKPGLRRGWGLGLQLIGVSNQEFNATPTTVPKLQIGSYSAHNTRLFVGRDRIEDAWNENPAPAKFHPKHPSMYGMLGIDFLKKHSAVIDCEGGKLWLRAPVK